MTVYADVVLPLPLEQSFTYSVPPEFEERVRTGVRVLVPFGERQLTGFIVRLRSRKPKHSPTLKTIQEVLDEDSQFSGSFLSFTEKLSRHYLVPWGEILQAAVPPSLLLKSRTIVSLTSKGRQALEQGTLSEDEMAVVSRLARQPHAPRFLERLCRGQNIAVLLARLQKNELVAVRRDLKRVRRKTKAESAAGPAQLELDFALNEDLSRTADAILTALAKRAFAPFLLFGSPDRREPVYFRVLREVLAGSGRALFLIPEISLTHSLIESLGRKIGENVAVLHSRMTERQREIEWQKARENRAGVVVGPRSALFAPLDNVRLIILDEEHDDSYSQQEGLSYDVRTAARLRAEEEKAVLIFGSARPTVAGFFRAKKGCYLIDVGGERKSTVHLADSRKNAGLVSRPILTAVTKSLNRREPALIFFNRRGYASHLVCSRCGFIPRCARCDLALSYHKKESKLVCHYCRFAIPAAGACPQCGGRLVVRRGAGIEAVAEEMRKAFPQGRIEVFAADETGRKEERERILKAFQTGEIDILLGTQLLAHQADLAKVSFVGILHPEMILHLADFRSAEKAFHMITGALRFLRDDAASEAIIQTASPEHFSIREAARGDYRAFYDREIRFRRLMDYPPFSALAEVVLTGEKLRKVAAVARAFAGRAREAEPVITVLGPALAPVSRIRGLYRIQIILRAARRASLGRFLTVALKGISVRKSVFLSD
jgi:primosomal protein N' (replication factor Y)